MGSPITFSGFNQIDFNMILNAVMAQERAPLTRIEDQRKALETQNASYGVLAGKLSALQGAADALRAEDAVASLKATSSDSAIGVSATTGSAVGSYDIVVSELARPQVTSSETMFSSPAAIVAGGGTLTLTSRAGASVDVVISASTTLTGVAGSINSFAEAPAIASVVRTGPDIYRLVLTAKQTGIDGAFTVQSDFAGSDGVAFVDADGDGISGDSSSDNTQVARDATFTVNNLSITSGSNTVTDVVPGVTLTLKKSDPALFVRLEVSRDTDAPKDRVKKFISAYNDIVAFAKEQASAGNRKANISRDSLLRSFSEAMRQRLLDTYGATGIVHLTQLGLALDSSGKLSLDERAFKEALQTSPDGVQRLLRGSDGTEGAFGRLTALTKQYTQSGGLLAAARDRLNDQARGLTRRLDDMEANLAIRRAALQREYAAADQAMTRLRSQSATLGGLGGQYRLY